MDIDLASFLMGVVLGGYLGWLCGLPWPGGSRGPDDSL